MGQHGEPNGVSLRPWQTDDVAFLASLMQDAEVRRFVGGPVEREEALRRARRLTDDLPWGYFVVVVGSDLVGTLGSITSAGRGKSRSSWLEPSGGEGL